MRPFYRASEYGSFIQQDAGIHLELAELQGPFMKQGKLNFWGNEGSKFRADSRLLWYNASVTDPQLRNMIKQTCASPDAFRNSMSTGVMSV